MRLKIRQVGEPVLRKSARNLTSDEIRSDFIQQLIAHMRETMRDAPGVGLAAPQIDESIRLAVIEDCPEYIRKLTDQAVSERDRCPVPFHVIINPELTPIGDETAHFFEGCLSLDGFTAIVGRKKRVRVTCLNEQAERVVIEAKGWYARILQHEIDHLNGTVYIDHMEARTFMSMQNYERYWKEKEIAKLRRELASH